MKGLSKKQEDDLLEVSRERQVCVTCGYNESAHKRNCNGTCGKFISQEEREAQADLKRKNEDGETRQEN